MKKAVVFAGVIGLAFLALRGCFGHTESWNQRLTLVVETPHGDVRGSAVTRVENEIFGPLSLADGSMRVRWTGEAAALEVLPGRWLFALLEGAGAVDAGYWVYTAYDLWSGGGAYGYHFPKYTAVRTQVLAQPLDVPVPLTPEGGPMLVTFDDITKPETVRRVDPEDLAAVFGEGVRLKAVTLEITEEAVTEGRVEGVLPWLESVGRERGTLISNPPVLSTDLSDPEIQLLGPGAFSTELYK